MKKINKKIKNIRIIVALSGGKASAWCARWALEKYSKENVVLYFNDTKWEHKDLYRFLSDLEKHFNHRITFDSDGRSPEQLFYDNKAIANNRMPFCSRILKAERLQNFYRDGDIIIFGIDKKEPIRAKRIIDVYNNINAKKKKKSILKFPLIIDSTTDEQIDNWLRDIGITEPLLYSLGFSHNNCSGGCVRAGKKHWKLLYEKLPEVYLDRERVEREVRAFFKKDIHFFKDETLESFRKRIESGSLSSYYYKPKKLKECVGICNKIN